MRVKIKNYDEVVDYMPCIGDNDNYMIMVGFSNGESMCYSFVDRYSFLDEYRRIKKNVRYCQRG